MTFLFAVLLKAMLSFSVLNAKGKLDLMVTLPEHSEFIGVSVACEHSERTSARRLEPNRSQIAISFPNLHGDRYVGHVLVIKEDGSQATYEREIFVTD